MKTLDSDKPKQKWIITTLLKESQGSSCLLSQGKGSYIAEVHPLRNFEMLLCVSLLCELVAWIIGSRRHLWYSYKNNSY